MKAFADRRQAGRELAQLLLSRRGDPEVVVVGLPRGGVPVAEVVAEELAAPLDVIVVRKLGTPGNRELAMGAIGEDDVRVLNRQVIDQMGVSSTAIERVEAAERTELARRASRFRQGRKRIPLAGHVVVIVDDGVATGSTMRAACEVARAEGAKRIIVAVPVAPPGWTERMAGLADEFVCVSTPPGFFAVGQWYVEFTQTSDDEVVASLARASGPSHGDNPQPRDAAVQIGTDGVVVEGQLTVPPSCIGIVVFVHGSGSSHHSPRNRFVASELNRAGIATLLFDLLTPAEERDRANVFDIELLARRLVEVTAWLRREPGVGDLPLGYFGASTGAGAALWAAAAPDSVITAVVSRGGRPDLAAPRLEGVRAPTLLIVGGRDLDVLDMNRRAQLQMRCEATLRVVEGATHLFEEPGALSTVADLACDWFSRHFALSQLGTAPS